MNRKTFAFLAAALAFLALPLAAWTQETPLVYRIADIQCRIDGHTKPNPLIRELELRVGREFPDRAALDAYVADRSQVLSNLRMLEKSELTYTLGDPEEGVVPVVLDIYAKDTWNLIALPYPKYSTNDGFLFSLRARDYNFLGTLETLALDFNYTYDENGQSAFGVGVEFSLPFELAGLDWSFDTDQSYALDLSGQSTYTDENTLKLNVRRDGLLWTFRLGQNVYWNADGSDDDDPNLLILQSLAGVDTEISLGTLDGLGTLTLTPTLEAGQKYRADGGVISEFRRGPYITASGTLGVGRADWVGNFRRGTILELYNANTYNFLFQDWTLTYKAQAEYFNVWANRLGLNSRLTLYHQVSRDKENDIGSYLRGIPDDDIDGDYAAFLNLDLPLRLFDFKPSLLIKKDWFDFEVHASPFVDAAVVRTYSDSAVHPYLAGGLELFGFLKRARSIYARLSLGINALDYLDTRSLSGNYELFFGLGHDY